MTETTQLLIRWRNGDEEAQNEVFEQLFNEMRRISSRLIAREAAISISTDDLLNEGALRLIKLSDISWQDRTHFLAMAARVMRRVLVDHAEHDDEKRHANVRERVNFK